MERWKSSNGITVSEQRSIECRGDSDMSSVPSNVEVMTCDLKPHDKKRDLSFLVWSTQKTHY
jgi:hypothetical protein